MHLFREYLFAAVLLLASVPCRAQMGNVGAPEGGSFLEEYTNILTVDEPWHFTGDNVLVVGEGPRLRAMLPYGGSPDNGAAFAELVGRYAEAFPDQTVYCMPIPTACEFYTPYTAEPYIRSQAAVIRNIFIQLSPDIRPVNVYTPLAQHAAEDIYARTDHRWLPLGAFYAARAFATVAEVPFRELDAYRERPVTGYTGTLYRYTGDDAVGAAAEDFVRYVPWAGRGLRPEGRKLLIIKDGSGKILSEFLQYSFQEVHLVDCRRFSGDFRRLVANRGITDILFACDLEHIGMQAVLDSLNAYLDR